MNAEKARSILKDVHPDDWKPLHHAAHGYLAALEGEEVKALVKALEQIAELQYLRPQPSEEIANEALAAFRKQVIGEVKP